MMLLSRVIFGISCLALTHRISFAQVASIRNYHEVDAHVSRAAQPSAVQFAQLKATGFCTVLNLRRWSSDKRKLRDLDLHVERVRINTWRMSYIDLVQALSVVRRSSCPVLIHCRHGADRTGAVVAAYRIAYQGWSKDEAIDEFVGPGFGFHARWFGNLVRLVRSVDASQLRREVEAAVSNPVLKPGQ